MHGEDSGEMVALSGLKKNGIGYMMMLIFVT